MTTTISTNEMRVWIGCLACYNGGSLTGKWVPALEASAFIPCTRLGHEEFWVMDHDGLGLDSECSPHEAQAIAETMADISNDFDVEIVTAYASNLGYKLAEFRDVWQAEFEDSFQGVHQNWDTFANDVYENLGLTDTHHDSYLIRYFDFDKFARDLEHDYFTADTTNGLAVFLSI